MLIAAGRFEDPTDVITEPVTGNDEVVTGVITSSDPPPLDPVTPIATDEYEGEPLTTRVALLDEVCLDTSDEASGNSWRLAGVGGLITAEPEEPLVLALPPDSFLADAGTAWATIDCELIPGN